MDAIKKERERGEERRGEGMRGDSFMCLCADTVWESVWKASLLNILFVYIQTHKYMYRD